MRSAERLIEFGAALFTRYLGASAYAALPETVARQCAASPCRLVSGRSGGIVEGRRQFSRARPRSESTTRRVRFRVVD